MDTAGGTKDSFEHHFGRGIDSSELDRRVSIVDKRIWQSESRNDTVANQQYLLFECDTVDTAEEGQRRKAFDQATLDELRIKKRLQLTWSKGNVTRDAVLLVHKHFEPLQSLLFYHMNQYRDVLFSDRNAENARAIISLYCLQALNHVYKTRDQVLKNTAKIATLKTLGQDVNDIRDQGFTRPKVLIIVPFRNSAFNVMEELLSLSGCEQVDKKNRFHDEFGPAKENSDSKSDDFKSSDFNQTFAGNIDDHFRMGIKFTRKTAKLYSPFYASDIIIASPLGLKMIIGSEGDKKRDYDYLSSIEMVIVDQCDTFLMQNWEHLQTVFHHLNLMPKEAHDCDFSRVRPWYLDERAQYLRQTLLFSQYMTPEINSLFNNQMKNVDGKIKTKHAQTGSIFSVMTQVKHVFTRLECASYEAVDEMRFNHFVDKTLPALRHSSLTQSHTLIFIPSYFDFVRVRNYFMESELNFAQLSEYTSTADVSRARSDFFHGRRPFLLITERFHFYRRYRIRGVRRVVFYSPPENGQFYPEIVNWLGLPSAPFIKGQPTDNVDLIVSSSKGGAVGVLYSKFDRFKLERIVGSSRVGKMCVGSKTNFLFA